jgi:hypothetical protein
VLRRPFRAAALAAAGPDPDPSCAHHIFGAEFVDGCLNDATAWPVGWIEDADPCRLELAPKLGIPLVEGCMTESRGLDPCIKGVLERFGPRPPGADAVAPLATALGQAVGRTNDARLNSEWPHRQFVFGADPEALAFTGVPLPTLNARHGRLPFRSIMCSTMRMEWFSVHRTPDGYVVIDLASAACTPDDLAQDAAEGLAAELNAMVSAGHHIDAVRWILPQQVRSATWCPAGVIDVWLHDKNSDQWVARVTDDAGRVECFSPGCPRDPPSASPTRAGRPPDSGPSRWLIARQQLGSERPGCLREQSGDA